MPVCPADVAKGGFKNTSELFVIYTVDNDEKAIMTLKFWFLYGVVIVMLSWKSKKMNYCLGKEIEQIN